MKKLFKSMFVMAALTSSLFLTSCKDETIDPTKESAAPTLTVNDGNLSTSVSQTIDTIFIKCLASADTDRKIKKLTITRAVTGGGTNTITQPVAYDAKDVIYTHKDVIVGLVAIDEDDVITYAVTIEDDKAKVTTKTYKVNISSVDVSNQILLGAPSNTVNLFRFFGTADEFRQYSAGTSGANLAKDNSSKIDFVYFYSTAGSTGNALYSPDFVFQSGDGWHTETARWPSKNKTLYKLTPITSSEFDALQGKAFLDELELIDFEIGTQNRVANLEMGQVLAYIKKGNNKRGFIFVAQRATATNGQITLKVKAEL